MTRLAKRLTRLPLDERRKIQGIGLRRAEIVVAGAMVYHELLDRLHLKDFRYSPLGLRDGLLAQMAAEHDRSTRSGRQIESERWESITKAVTHYRVDMKHALDVRDSAMFLFSALAFCARPRARISRMALRRCDALRGGRLRQPQRPSPSHLLHHFEFGDSWLHAATASPDCRHRTLFRKVAPPLDEAPIKALDTGGPPWRAEGDHASPPGARAESGPQPGCTKSSSQPARAWTYT